MKNSDGIEQQVVEPVTDKLKNLEGGDQIEVNCMDETLTVVSTNQLPRPEVRVEASDGSKYDIRETLLEHDLLEIEPRTVFSEPRIVRTLEVVGSE